MGKRHSTLGHILLHGPGPATRHRHPVPKMLLSVRDEAQTLLLQVPRSPLRLLVPRREVLLPRAHETVRPAQDQVALLSKALVDDVANITKRLGDVFEGLRQNSAGVADVALDCADKFLQAEAKARGSGRL